MRSFKKKKAQQLIEFLLAAPFLIAFLALVTEYAYALNVNMTLSQGVKTVTAEIYKSIKPDMTSDSVKNLVYTKLVKYLEDNNIVTNYALIHEDAVSINTLTVDDSTIFIANYRYYTAFSLPNHLISILPDKFDFMASAVVPKAFLADNSAYTIESSTLNNINGDDSSLPQSELYRGYKHGVLNEQTTYRDNMLFLYPTTIPSIGDAYFILYWSGNALSRSGDFVFAKKDSSAIYTCNAMFVCTTDASYNWNSIVTAKNPKNIVFVNDSTANWLLAPAGATDFSPANVTGRLKNAVALVEPNGSSKGNYDNLSISYNSFFSKPSYTVRPLYSLLFTYLNTSDSLTVEAICNYLEVNGGSSLLKKDSWGW